MLCTLPFCQVLYLTLRDLYHYLPSLNPFCKEQYRDVLKTVGCEMCSPIERSTIWKMGEGEGDVPILDSSSILTALPGNEPTGSLLGERFLICNCPQICPKIGRTKKREILMKSMCLEIPKTGQEQCLSGN